MQINSNIYSVEKTPKLIYHYCSIESFLNIIKSKKIFLSNSTSLNDHLESKWIKQIIKQIHKKKGSNFDWHFIHNIQKIFAQYREGIYIACFSRHQDLLSQWCKYAQDATGVAIGFKTIELRAK